MFLFRYFISLFCGYFLLSSICVAQLAAIDSAKKNVVQSKSEKEYIQSCFFIADSYMDIEQYDSAQIWLNEIHGKLPIKTNSLSNYFLITRQAEVYYYNNLQQLGLQESRRGLAMAQALNDSLLLADSYNFLGLFYMNIDSVMLSIPFYKNGFHYTKQPPYPSNYLSLTKPHHLYGNLAEAYYKLKNYDSSLFYNLKSLEKATQINWQRGIAVAHAGLGDVFFELNKIDSSLNNYVKGVNTALHSKDIDVALICYGGMAKCYQSIKNNASIVKSLDDGFELLKQYPNINRFYALNFLSTAIDIYRKQNNHVDLAKALELKSFIETANIKGSNAQIQTILNASVANEKRLLNLEVEDAKQKQKLANTRLVLALSGFGLLAIGFLVYRYYQNQKLAVSRLRQKISQDLHDDVGASLSSLQIYGAIAEQSIKTNPDKALEMVHKISTQSKEIMENMNDIVWSMKNNSTSNTSLEIKIKNYAVNLLNDSNIYFTYNIMPNADEIITGITARKNILLIVKEAMNNMAKYSKAKNAQLDIFIKDKELVLVIADDGIGFDTVHVQAGNGLENMQQRTTELKGIFQLTSTKGKGTTIQAIFPQSQIH